MAVEFRLRFRSGNQAVVDDPADAIVHAFEQAQGKLPLLMEGMHVPIRDRNGNLIGEAWVARDVE